MSYEDVAKLAIMRIAKTAEEAQNIMRYLVTVDWHKEFTDAEIDAKETMEELANIAKENFFHNIDRGGGICDYCHELKAKLYAWPYPVAPQYGYSHGRYCWKCFTNHEDHSIKMIRMLHRCHSCDRPVPFKSLYEVAQNGRYGNLYCLHCIDNAVENSFILCIGCGKKTLNYSNRSKKNEFCNDCQIRYPYQSNVSSHLGRARNAGTPATLTVVQWRDTIAHFNGKCAYCRVTAFEVLEHFLPISLGGGTTFENCVPSCSKCNHRKNDKHPDKLSQLFPQENIEYIKQYLQGEKQSVNPFLITDRALMIVPTIFRKTRLARDPV